MEVQQSVRSICAPFACYSLFFAPGNGLWKVLEYDRTDAEYSQQPAWTMGKDLRELQVRGLGLQAREGVNRTV